MTRRDITPEMIAALGDLREFALRIRAEPVVGSTVRKAQQAIDLLDNADFFVPIDDAHTD